MAEIVPDRCNWSCLWCLFLLAKKSLYQAHLFGLHVKIIFMLQTFLISFVGKSISDLLEFFHLKFLEVQADKLFYFQLSIATRIASVKLFYLATDTVDNRRHRKVGWLISVITLLTYLALFLLLGLSEVFPSSSLLTGLLPGLVLSGESVSGKLSDRCIREIKSDISSLMSGKV